MHTSEKPKSAFIFVPSNATRHTLMACHQRTTGRAEVLTLSGRLSSNVPFHVARSFELAPDVR